MKLADCKVRDKLTICMDSGHHDMVRGDPGDSQVIPVLVELVFFDKDDTSQPFAGAFPIGQPTYPTPLASMDHSVIPDWVHTDAYSGWRWLWRDTWIIGSIRQGGMTCDNRNCNERYYPYAQPNQPNGGFLCWSCRQLPSYMRKMS